MGAVHFMQLSLPGHPHQVAISQLCQKTAFTKGAYGFNDQAAVSPGVHDFESSGADFIMVLSSPFIPGRLVSFRGIDLERLATSTFHFQWTFQ